MSIVHTRREFVQLAAASAFVCGFHVPLGAGAAQRAAFAPNAFIRIDARGDVALTIPQVEMGQGTYTSLAMILAEELDAHWSAVRVEHAPADEGSYANPLLAVQLTGNSTSIRAFWIPLRRAGAAVRERLIEAAANRWNVPAAECRTREGKVVHDDSGRVLDYSALIESASSVAQPESVRLKDVGDFRLIGRSMKRLDAPDKATGVATYGIDVVLPGMQIAVLAHSPVCGGTVARVSDARARAIPGVTQVVVLRDLVAVVGSGSWSALRGLEALEVSWNGGVNAGVSSSKIWSLLREASRRNGAVAKEVGRADEALSDGSASELFAAEYELPLLAHACMEPLNCTLRVTSSGAEVWLGTQVMGRVRAAVAKALGLSEARVTVHNHLLGGGFGRRLESDMAYDAARIAKYVRGPVKVVWSREEDIRHDVYRPAYHNVLTARLRRGRITGWKHKVTGSAVLARFLPAGFRNGVDLDAVESAHDSPYDIPHYRVEFNREEPPGVVTGLWRGVGSNNAVFAIESFMDELARRAGEDPIEFRRAHLSKTPRLLAVLDLARRKSDWDTALPTRCGRGVAAQSSFGSYMATVVECAVDDIGEIELRRVTAVIDAGLAVHPDTIVAQVQGGVIFGLTAALFGEITLDHGRVQQSNFHDYPLMRINQAPPIDVHVIDSAEAPGGVGEAGTTAATPALRNAILAATGIALRRMPIDRKALAINPKP